MRREQDFYTGVYERTKLRSMYPDWKDVIEKVKYITGLHNLFIRTKDIPGHIIELGAGSGRNAVIFGNLLKLYNLSNSRDLTFKPRVSVSIEMSPLNDFKTLLGRSL